MKTINLHGIWNLHLDAEKAYTKPLTEDGFWNDTIVLPDSTAHAKKGSADREPSTEHMTDQYYFEGYAWYSRAIEAEDSWTDKQILLFLDRTRISTVYIDGEEISTQNSLCSSHLHDLTGKLTPGTHELTIRVNNTDYPTRGGHMTSPDTQSNWNGIVGRIELQIRDLCHPENLQVYARTADQVRVCADICGMEEGEAQVTVCRLKREDSDTTKPAEVLYTGKHAVSNGHLCTEFSLAGTDLLWDEYHPNLLLAEVTAGNETAAAVFGIRDLAHEGRRLLINGREVFLRGKHDGLTFPETGYAPMTAEGWKRVFQTAKEYGINHYRFHTCCPPEAAFVAADEMGIYLEPELPFWGTIAAPGEEGFQEAEQAYLVEEGYRILKQYGNHPSFVLFSMGNELWGSMERINGFLHAFKQYDGRHLYTQGSNNFQFTPAVLEEEDVFCGVRLAKDRLFRGSYAMCDAPQGHIQTEAPNSCHNYDAVIAPVQTEKDAAADADGYIEIQYGTGVKRVKAAGTEATLIPQVPVISHEIGQYDFFPDFSELDRHEGSMQPLYLNIYRERMEKSGTFEQWQEFYDATGALAVDCYRRELETALRSKELSGFQILDLQDFPGQCVALVGVLDAWMEPKRVVTPEQWRMFCSDTVVLGELQSFVVKAGQEIQMPVKLSVCNWEQFAGTQVRYRVSIEAQERQSAQTDQEEQENQIITEGSLPISRTDGFCGRVLEVGCAQFTIPAVEKPAVIRVSLWTESVTDSDGCEAGNSSMGQECGSEGRFAECSNEYTLWAYPDYEVQITETQICSRKKVLYLAHTTEEAQQYQSEQKPFLLIPQQGADDMEGTYCTDFWNYPMFRSISESMKRRIPIGTLGLLIRKEDALLKDFPSENYTTPQWYQLVTHSHCAVLDGKEGVRTIVQPIDNVERCHKLGMLYYQNEMPVCTSRLWEIGGYPEVKAFAKSLVDALVKDENR